MPKVVPQTVIQVQIDGSTEPSVSILVNDFAVSYTPGPAESAMVKEPAAIHQRAESALKRRDPAGYQRLLDTCDTPPFVSIDYEVEQGESDDVLVVVVKGKPVAKFSEMEEMKSFVADLKRKRHRMQEKLLRLDPTEYWRRYAEHLKNAVEQYKDPTDQLILRDGIAYWEGIDQRAQRAKAGRAKKPSRRAPLRQAIVEAMRPLRADGMTLHEVLRSLTQSPPGALRVMKDGANWHARHEDEDWPPEVLTLEQLRGLYSAAK